MGRIAKRICFGLLLAFSLSLLACDDANAGQRRRARDYSGYADDAAGLLDAVNRDYGTPRGAPYSGIGHGPTGALERNPYESRKWYRDETGMIDAINRDYGKPRPRPHSNIGTGPSGRLERNPYASYKWRRDESGLIDAIRRDYGR